MTMEELWWDGEGALRTHGPSTYKIPGSRDVPPVFNVHILEDSPNPHPPSSGPRRWASRR